MYLYVVCNTIVQQIQIETGMIYKFIYRMHARSFTLSSNSSWFLKTKCNSRKLILPESFFVIET